MSVDTPSLVTHTGGCHCGKVRFEVSAPAHITVSDCNCSICSRYGYLHLVVPGERFKLVSGREVLTTYTFNTGTAKHLFCSVCGVKSFYVPRSHPDKIDVNVRCLEGINLQTLTIQPFNGREWEKERHTLDE